MVGTRKSNIDPAILEAIKSQIASLKDTVLQEILGALAKLQIEGLTNSTGRDIIEESTPIFIPSDISSKQDTEISIQENSSKETGVEDAIESLRKARRPTKVGENNE